MIDRRLSIAPMMDHTDKHFRYLMRLLTKHSVLYTEMITTGALIHGNHKQFLDFNPEEHPIAIQLGGNSPKDLTKCAQMAENEGFDEVNLNIGCPSNRVQNGGFGAYLMAKKELVAECINSISNNIKIPVSIKTRIGIDNHDSFEFLKEFIDIVSKAGCETFIIHARKAVLQGLSPKENRKIPPLNYKRVYKIKENFPHLNIIINGGFTKLDQIKSQLKYVDGVMIGRSIYHSPYFLADIEKEIYSTENISTREEVIKELISYVKVEIKKGTKLHHIMKHTLGLFHGISGSSFWKRYLSENMCVRNADIQKVDHILDKVKYPNQNSVSI